MIAESDNKRQLTLRYLFQHLQHTFICRSRINDISGEDYKIRLFFVEYLINTFQCYVGSGILILEMDVGELYDFKFTVFIEA
jgi:hypothetical protein